MNHYLLIFNRRTGVLIRKQQISSSDEAMSARFAAEAQYRDDPDIEVVVLGAQSEDALRRTHSRYFTPPRVLAEDGARSFCRVESSERMIRMREALA